jgi:hypothetical protein
VQIGGVVGILDSQASRRTEANHFQVFATIVAALDNYWKISRNGSHLETGSTCRDHASPMNV